MHSSPGPPCGSLSSIGCSRRARAKVARRRGRFPGPPWSGKRRCKDPPVPILRTPIRRAIRALSVKYSPQTRWKSPWPHPCSTCQPPSNHRVTATRYGGPAGCRLRRRRHLRRDEAAALTRSDVECWAGGGAHPHHPLQDRYQGPGWRHGGALTRGESAGSALPPIHRKDECSGGLKG